MVFVSTGRTQADISGSVEVTDPLTNLLVVSYDGSGTDVSTVGVGKKWVIMGVGQKAASSAEGSVVLRTANNAGALIVLSQTWFSPEYLNQKATLPVLAIAGDTITIIQDGLFSYYEYDA